MHRCSCTARARARARHGTQGISKQSSRSTSTKCFLSPERELRAAQTQPIENVDEELHEELDEELDEEFDKEFDEEVDEKIDKEIDEAMRRVRLTLGTSSQLHR